jgi:hypothetical protein
LKKRAFANWKPGESEYSNKRNVEDPNNQKSQKINVDIEMSEISEITKGSEYPQIQNIKNRRPSKHQGIENIKKKRNVFISKNQKISQDQKQ